MGRFSPSVVSDNRSTDLIANAITDALSTVGQARDRKRQQGQQDAERTRANTLQDIGLAKEGIHLTQPGALPQPFDINVSGGPNNEDIIARAISPALAGQPAPATPMTATPSRNLAFGSGYYVDKDEKAAHQKESADAQLQATIQGALGKARGEELAHPGKAAADLDYTKALTQQAIAQAVRQPNPASLRIDPLSPEGIKAQRELKAYEAGLKPPVGLRGSGGASGVDGGKPTEFSGKAALVTPKAEESAKVLDEFYTKGVGVRQGILPKVPGVGNYFMSDDEQRAQQAAEAVSMAILRLESGASISDQEMKNQAKQITPLPGDSQAVRDQKRATLKTILTRMRAAAQPTLSREAPPTGNVDLGGDTGGTTIMVNGKPFKVPN